MIEICNNGNWAIWEVDFHQVSCPLTLGMDDYMFAIQFPLKQGLVTSLTYDSGGLFVGHNCNQYSDFNTTTIYFSVIILKCYQLIITYPKIIKRIHRKQNMCT